MEPLIESIQACNKLTELYSLCESDDLLRTDLANTRLVFGSGDETAKLMLVGEAPGKEEDEKGKPFVGRSGKLLLQYIEQELKLTREHVYIANILKHRPPENRDPKPAERSYALPYLKRQIELVNPSLILCVGRISAQTLLRKKYSLKDMRQKTFNFSGFPLAVSYHPAALLRNPNWKPAFIEDLVYIKNILF